LVRFNNGFSPTNVATYAHGVELATTASATTLAWTYAAGTGAAQIPGNLFIVVFGFTRAADANGFWVGGSDGTTRMQRFAGAAGVVQQGEQLMGALDGLLMTGSNAVAHTIYLAAYWDIVLGVGSNPLI
jgi:hypothetical protein